MCDFESSYACGYHNQGNSSARWVRVKVLQVTDDIGPDVDSSGSVLGI